MTTLGWHFYDSSQKQISTLAGNLAPSYFAAEVVFTMAIAGSGLLLFALLVGNMQNFLQALGKRMLEMSVRRHEAELWMRQRHLPESLQRRVRQADWYIRTATEGVKEEMLLEKLPEDLQIDIRRHLINYSARKCWVFAIMDDNFLDAISEKLRQKMYTEGTKVLKRDSVIERMVFIVRGRLQVVGEEWWGMELLRDGDICGEEILSWYAEHSYMYRDGRRIRSSAQGMQLLSNRTVACMTDVEALVLQATDLEEIIRRFWLSFQNPQVQAAIRYHSPYWRRLAAARIQVAWRYRKKRQSRANTSQPGHPPE